MKYELILELGIALDHDIFSIIIILILFLFL